MNRSEPDADTSRLEQVKAKLEELNRYDPLDF